MKKLCVILCRQNIDFSLSLTHSPYLYLVCVHKNTCMRVFFIMNAHGFIRFQPFRISLLYTETYSEREWDHEYYYDGGISKTNICFLKCVHLYFLKESMRQYVEESFFNEKIKIIYLWLKRENYRTTRESIAIFRKSLLCV